MDSIIKRRKYVEIDTLFQTRKELTLNNHVNKINIYKDAIELLFYLRDILNVKIYESAKSSGQPLSGPRALIPILYDRNNHYLIAAYKLTSNCLINPAYLNLRAVFEAIAQMYLLHLTEKEGNLFYKSQLNELNKEEKKEFRYEFKWIGPKIVRNILYSDEKKHQIDMFYKEISNSAHPSIKSAMNDFGYRDETVTDALDLILALSCANMIVINETFIDEFNEEVVIEIGNTLGIIGKELGGFMIDMIPNNPKLKKKPIIVL